MLNFHAHLHLDELLSFVPQHLQLRLALRHLPLLLVKLILQLGYLLAQICVFRLDSVQVLHHHLLVGLLKEDHLSETINVHFHEQRLLGPRFVSRGPNRKFCTELDIRAPIVDVSLVVLQALQLGKLAPIVYIFGSAGSGLGVQYRDWRSRRLVSHDYYRAHAALVLFSYIQGVA